MSQKIKILHVSASSVGGIGRIILDIANLLDKDRFEVSVSFGPEYSLDKEFVKNNIRIYRTSISRRMRLLANVKALYQLYHILKKEKFDIVHTYTSTGGLVGRIASKLSNTPVTIYHAAGYPLHQTQFSLSKRALFLFLERILNYFTDHYVAMSESLKQQTIEKGIARSEKISVIYHGVDLRRFDYVPCKDTNKLKRELELKHGVSVIGTIGRLDTQKGVCFLLRAASIILKLFPETIFLVVGDGPLRPQLEKLSQDLNISRKVLFTGWIEDVPNVLSVMDIFCLPSLWEAFGIVLVEAMAMRLPIVAANVEGIPEVMKDGETGILVPPKKPEALAAAIMKLLKDKTLARQMGEAGRKRVEEFFLMNTIIGEYERLYSKWL